jgi:hypothetical protein
LNHQHFFTKNSEAYFRLMAKLSSHDDKEERERQLQAMRRIAIKSIAVAKAKEAKPRWKKRLQKFFNKFFRPFDV